jgi:hypothetical protein
MGSITPPLNEIDSVRLRISVDKLSELIEAGCLCATDFSCLDHRSKTTVQGLFLRCCLDGCHAHRNVRVNRPLPVTDPPV